MAALTEFLADRNMVQVLNLRRNKITNRGAQLVADFLVDHDEEVYSLNLSRNRITQAGAESLLAALRQVIRITELQVYYGNNLPRVIDFDIINEVKANNQIIKNKAEQSSQGLSPKVKITQITYELLDKGPDFIRCAIKSVELLGILHLSLPDNMLGIDEARMIGGMLQKNPPLKTLNLQNNILDANCAQVIAQSLDKNDQLLILNMNGNKLGDLGVTKLLEPLVRQKFVEISKMKVTSKVVDHNSEGTSQQQDDEGFNDIEAPVLSGLNS